MAVKLDEFVRVYNESNSLDEVVSKLNMKKSAVYMRAYLLRKSGNTELKDMPLGKRGRKPKSNLTLIDSEVDDAVQKPEAVLQA